MIIEKEVLCCEAREIKGEVCNREKCPSAREDCEGCRNTEWIEEWLGGNPCPYCGTHSRLLIYLDGREEIIPCFCEMNNK